MEKVNKKIYEIVYERNEETKKQNKELLEKIINNGEHIKNELDYDHIISVYNYNNKIYRLFYNDNYGFYEMFEELEEI